MPVGVYFEPRLDPSTCQPKDAQVDKFVNRCPDARNFKTDVCVGMHLELHAFSHKVACCQITFKENEGLMQRPWGPLHQGCRSAGRYKEGYEVCQVGHLTRNMLPATCTS